MAMSDGPRKVVFQRECIVRVLELLSTQVLYIICLHKVRGHSRSSGAVVWSLMFALLGFDSHWMTLMSLMLVLKMCQTYKNVETCALLGYCAASSGNFLPMFLSQNVSIRLSNLHHVLSQKSGYMDFFVLFFISPTRTSF
jgi:hypothetical protein